MYFILGLNIEKVVDYQKCYDILIKEDVFFFFSNVLSNKHFLVDSFKSSDINVSNSLKGKAYIKKSSRKLYNRFMY